MEGGGPVRFKTLGFFAEEEEAGSAEIDQEGALRHIETGSETDLKSSVFWRTFAGREGESES